MEGKTTLSIPQYLESLGNNYFGETQTRAAKNILSRSPINISFYKGAPESYFICSGIVQDGNRYEVKVVFKRKGKNASVSSTCKCSDWTEERHCYHACALFLSFHIMQDEQQNGAGIILENATLSSSSSVRGVSVQKYGTIVGGPHFLIGAASNAAYSSMPYLLADKRTVNFPLPENFNGKLILEMISPVEKDSSPEIIFKYRESNEDIIEEISIFENLYLFDWKKGKCYYLPRDVKEIVQKIRLGNCDINSVVRMIFSLSSWICWNCLWMEWPGRT